MDRGRKRPFFSSPTSCLEGYPPGDGRKETIKKGDLQKKRASSWNALVDSQWGEKFDALQRHKTGGVPTVRLGVPIKRREGKERR